jgi:nucleoside-diphosphate-sugar epimerase
MRSLRILISGCGRIGGKLGTLLVERGHQVWGLRRHPELLPEQIFPTKGDLFSGEGLSNLPPALDFVFHFSSTKTQTTDAYRLAYEVGITNLIQALLSQKQNIQRIFFISSTGVYAQNSGEWVDEESETEPNHAAGEYLLQGEHRVIESPYPGTIVRFAGIYGPKRLRLLERVSDGKEFCAEDRTQYINLLHEADCAAILDHLMLVSRPRDLYLAVDCFPVDRCLLVTWLAGQLGAPQPRSVPADSLPPRVLRSNKRCSNRRLLESGYCFIYPTFQEGYAPLVGTWKDTH